MNEQEHLWKNVPSGMLPCPSCGVAVEVMEPEKIEVVELYGGNVRHHDETGVVRHMSEVVEVEVLRCRPCEQIRATASDLMMSIHRRLRSNIGDSGIAVYRAEMALVALDALGITDARRIDLHTETEGEFARTLEYLVAAGAGACWLTHARGRGRVAAVLLTAPSSTRWGHLTGPARRALNEASVELHRSRTEKPVPVLALDEDGRPTGCLLCGVRAVDALPSLATRVWTASEVDSDAVGGPMLAEPIEGVLCHFCDRAVDAAGGLGQSAMKISVLESLGLSEWSRTPVGLNVTGWCVTGRPANLTPWAHVDLDAVRLALSEAGVGPLLV